MYCKSDQKFLFIVFPGSDTEVGQFYPNLDFFKKNNFLAQQKDIFSSTVLTMVRQPLIINLSPILNNFDSMFSNQPAQAQPTRCKLN